MNETRIWFSILVVVLVTALIRFLPFVVFGGKRKVPKIIEKLSRTLPYAVMGMLVVYCLKGTDLTAMPFGIPEVLSVCIVAALHIWKRNTLLSILCGTVCYMVLVQMVF
jgi:branched-subunit amino acid transport protein AzlD